MPVGPDDLALQVAKGVADVYGDAVAGLLRIVARRLAQGIEEPGWAERKLAEVEALRRQALEEVARLGGEGLDAVDGAVRAGWDAGAASAVADLDAAEIASGLIGSQERAVRALVEEAVGQVAATHGQILRSTLDVYRSVIVEAAASPVLAGSTARRGAAQAALDRFAARGIVGFVDGAGRRWELESYAEMATRTAVGRAQVAGALDRFEGAGRDLVIVSDAPQECKVCRRWEGKVLSISGDDRRYPSVARATSDGLFHANCRHRLGLYVPGLTRRFTHTADADGDQARQQQRYLERGVRRWKRTEAVALDDAAQARAKAKAGEWQRRLREHVEANDLKRLPHRERLGAR